LHSLIILSLLRWHSRLASVLVNGTVVAGLPVARLLATGTMDVVSGTTVADGSSHIPQDSKR